MKLLTADAALQYFLTYMKVRGTKVMQVKRYNQDRHFLVQGYPNFNEQEKWYVVYKKEPFYTFNQQFEKYVKEHPEHEGEGESINHEWLQLAMKESIPASKDIEEIELKIIFIYPDGSMYWAYPQFFYKYAKTHNLFRMQEKYNHYNRKDYTGQTDSYNEVTYSLPVCMLKKIDFKKDHGIKGPLHTYMNNGGITHTK